MSVLGPRGLATIPHSTKHGSSPRTILSDNRGPAAWGRKAYAKVPVGGPKEATESEPTGLAGSLQEQSVQSAFQEANEMSQHAKVLAAQHGDMADPWDLPTGWTESWPLRVVSDCGTTPTPTNVRLRVCTCDPTKQHAAGRKNTLHVYS